MKAIKFSYASSAAIRSSGSLRRSTALHCVQKKKKQGKGNAHISMSFIQARRKTALTNPLIFGTDPTRIFKNPPLPNTESYVLVSSAYTSKIAFRDETTVSAEAGVAEPIDWMMERRNAPMTWSANMFVSAACGWGGGGSDTHLILINRSDGSAIPTRRPRASLSNTMAR